MRSVRPPGRTPSAPPPSAAPFEAPLDQRATRARLEAQLEQLAQDVDATRRDEGFREAVEAMARFWRYSLVNQFLIRVQRPLATRVAGRHAWEALGRKVKPGERPIRVLAPSFRRDGAVRFVDVEVFDLRQTRGRRVPTLDLVLPGRTRHARALERAAVLAHELAHVVLAVLGLPSKAPTYIAWQGGTGLGVLRSMSRIQRAAKVILGAVGGAAGESRRTARS